MISWFYLLVYILNEGRLMNINIETFLTPLQNLRQIKNAKMNHKIKDVCNYNSKCLKKLMVIIFSLDYEETPPYQEIR